MLVFFWVHAIVLPVHNYFNAKPVLLLSFYLKPFYKNTIAVALGRLSVRVLASANYDALTRPISIVCLHKASKYNCQGPGIVPFALCLYDDLIIVDLIQITTALTSWRHVFTTPLGVF